VKIPKVQEQNLFALSDVARARRQPGSDPHTITLAAEIVVTEDVVIDGGGLVTLSGGGTTRILHVDSSFERETPHLDPQLGTLADHGGPTWTIEPGAGSPAIGLATGCPATEQRGEPRSDPCTAGAFEVVPSRHDRR
jgi:hypothetical protein